MKWKALLLTVFITLSCVTPPPAPVVPEEEQDRPFVPVEPEAPEVSEEGPEVPEQPAEPEEPALPEVSEPELPEAVKPSLPETAVKKYLKQEEAGLSVYYVESPDGGYDFYADNDHFVPLYLYLEMKKLVNLTSSESLPLKEVLKPGVREQFLFSLRPQKKASYSFSSSYLFTEGDPSSVPDDYLYLLPYEHGKKYKLSQGYNGRVTHFGSNAFALDFTMDTGTPITAARGGVVVRVKEDSNRGGVGEQYAKYGNLIVIYHEDGTFGYYVHLKKNGALVNVGDKVDAGQLIGYSGNTGQSSGPHLHFSVNLPGEKGESQSIPTKFRNLDGSPFDPKAGQFYYAAHPGKSEFSVTFGRDLTDGDFNDHLAAVPKSNKLSSREEVVDDTYILYFRNGYDKEVTLDLTMKLNNMKSSKGNKIRLVLPPLSEVYACLIRPVIGDRPAGYALNMSYQYRE